MQDESSKSTGQTSDDGMTSKHSRLNRSEIGRSTLLLAASHVSQSPLEEKDCERPTNDGCGRTRRTPFAFLDRVSWCWRTYQGCLMEGLARFSGRWPEWGTIRNGASYRRVPSVHHIHVKECSLLPTPTASMGKRGFGFSRTGRRRMNRQTLARVHAIGWTPSPEYQEWLMGFPDGWTELDASETPSSPPSPNGSET